MKSVGGAALLEKCASGVGFEGPSLTSFLVGSFCFVLAVEDVLHQSPAVVASCHASPTIMDSFFGTISPNKLVLP